MRIGWFTHRYYPCLGGAEAFGRAMVRRFAARGDSVEVLTTNARDLWYFTDRRRARLDAPHDESVDGARVRRFPVRHIPLQRYVGKLLSYTPHWPTRCRIASYMPILPDLQRVQGPYDLNVAVGFPFTLFSYEALRVARASGGAVVLVPFLHLASPGDPVRQHTTKPHQIRLLREADCVVSVTRLEAEAVAGFGVDPSRILVLPLGIDVETSTGGDAAAFLRRWPIRPGGPVVGHLATLDPNKGTCDLVEAVAMLNARRPANPAVQLVLAGGSSPAFERYAAERNLDAFDWLIRTGPISDAEKRDFFAGIDVFAMPSRTDSFGLVFLESWANGKPVVAAASGGVAEVIHQERDGFLVPFGDREALAASVARLIDDPALARSLGATGRQRVELGLTWDHTFQVLSQRAGLLASRPTFRSATPHGRGVQSARDRARLTRPRSS